MLNVSAGAVSPSSSRWLVFMTVLAVYICMIDRIAISIAIIPMAEDNGWSPTVQGAVMSAFFLGYVTLQIPAGYLSDRFGGKWVLGLGVLFWSLFTADARICGTRHYGAAGVPLSDGGCRSGYLAVDLLTLFALGAPGPTRFRCRAHEFRYFGWQRDRADLHALAD